MIRRHSASATVTVTVSAQGAAAVAAAAVTLLAGCKPSEPTQDTFARVLRQHIDSHAELCVGRHAWPIDVPDVPERATLRDYQQLNALEHAGLVTHESGLTMKRDRHDGTFDTVPAWRYTLTDTGRTFFKAHPETANAHATGMPDLCYGKIRLQQVRGWTPIQRDPDAARDITTVTYTYTIDAAPWTHDDAVQRAFPVVARVVNGSGKDELRQDVAESPNGWIVR
ncbi:hypothetical protein FOB72_28690 [Cupriavidus pauculus]|uniref:Lipoprotein n=1 Tax=Cupriavidus pauculus TaxID=82633 RepID=A0A5P2HDL6_9BURK|nr:hypothetical protein [Cupriavidus pauculus]QET05918.1 hypothetical protein FOB72_28690 [Cupriavidus pauculus]